MRSPEMLKADFPHADAATAERLEKPLLQIVRQLIARGFHPPHIEAALRAVADQVPKVEPNTLGPWNDPLDDLVITMFEAGYNPQDPTLACVNFRAKSAKEFGILVHVGDLRRMGEEFIKIAGKQAQVAAKAAPK